MSEAQDDIPPYGPRMAALANDRQRAFVAALYDEEAPLKGEGLLIHAARVAEYGSGTSSNKVLSTIANRLVHDDRIREAVAEYSRNLVRAISPEAVKAVRNLIRDPKAKDHARAVAMILDRVDPPQTSHTVTVKDERAPLSPAELEKVLLKIDELARRAGIISNPPPLLIEGEFKTIEEGAPA